MRGPLPLPSGSWESWLDERVEQQLAEARRLVVELRSGEDQRSTATMASWNALAVALRNAADVSAVMVAVHPEAEVRDRAERGEQDVTALLTEIGMDRAVYDRLAGVAPEELDDGGRRVLALALRDFRRAGVDRDETARARLVELSVRETTLSQTFMRNVQESATSISLPPERLEGLPEDFLTQHPPGADDLVRVSTDYPDFVPFMTFAQDREQRRRLVEAFLNRAWPDNDAVLRELLELRREHAELLGYDGWPAYDAEVTMIGDGAAIPAFLDRLAAATEATAAADHGTLLARLRRDHPEATVVDATDRSFYTEVVRREDFGVDAHEVRGYFDFAKVRSGLLEVTGRLFDLTYREVIDTPSWHNEVTSYDVVRDGEVLGRVHLDLHPRPDKYGHPAQFDLVAGLADLQLPEGVLVGNFSRSLLEHSHVVTLFHEFGHLLHHVLAGHHRWLRFSGVATESDFVEAPSQLLEEWAWDPEVLRSFATDAAGRAIPRELVSRMRAGDEFGVGVHVRSQLFYAALSHALHAEVPEDLTARMLELQATYDTLAHVPGTHFFTAFHHLVNYGSGYYTYLWSLVIAKDLLSGFDADDLLAPGPAHRYRDQVLAAGGSAPAEDLVGDFLGRPYDFAAFERWLSR